MAAELNYESKLFYRNMKDIPPVDLTPNSPYRQLIQWEKQKCAEGLNINGNRIPGTLYYALNHCAMGFDYIDPATGQIKLKIDRPLLRDTDWEMHHAYEAARLDKKGLVLGSARQIGKDLDNNCKIYTEKGPKRIGDAQVGDKIYDDSGYLTTITGVFPQGIRPIYRLIFTDDRVIHSGEDHLWRVYNYNTKEYEVLKLKELLTKNIRDYGVQMCKPVQYPEKKLEKSIEDYAYEISHLKVEKIPEEILYSSVNHRRMLVNKLFTRSYFVSRSPQILKDVASLVRSLGLCCVLDLKLRQVYMTDEIKVCPIKEIKFDRHAPTTCISVDNESKLFLTDDYTVTHNTELLVIFATHELFINKDSEVLVLLSSKKDKQSFTKKLDIHIKHNTPFIVVPNIDKDLSKEMIRFGTKFKDNETFEYSKLFIYITQEGNNTEVAAGKTVSLALFDEIAKAPFIEVHEALLPAAMSNLAGSDGLRSKMFYCFTGGDQEKFSDAKKLFYNPETYHFKAFDEDKTGFFLDATYRSKYKEETTLGTFLTDKYGRPFNNEELDNFPILVKNTKKANEDLDKELEEAKKESKVVYNKRRMYYPRKKSDMFLAGENNIFSIISSDLEAVRDYLIHNAVDNYRKVEFHRNKFTNELTVYESNKRILTDFPHNGDASDLDTPVVIVKEPDEVFSGKLYVMGADLFNVNKTSSSPSLGSFYVMQRAVDDYTNPWNDRIVAYYNGRKDLRDMTEKLICTLMYYGAEQGNITLLHEAPTDTLTQLFAEKGIAYMLEDSYNLSREITNTSARTTKGLYPTPKIQSYGLDRTLDYLTEDLPDGRLGVWRIPDPYLISQMMVFDGDLGPCDALVAFFHTVIHLNKERRFRAPLIKQPGVYENLEINKDFRRGTSKDIYRRRGV